VVALKVRELLQPAAKERQREAVIESNKARATNPVPADLRDANKSPQLTTGQRAVEAAAVADEMRTQEADRKRRERETAATDRATVTVWPAAPAAAGSSRSG
jgi:hypothetical protein